ncbi:hypothetical protein F1847_06140 [Thermodesulfobacterium sp. TA1]|uniref:AsmA-like C-terminal domain-containing protein n=1 Tax=Thermodesulfobacterium sp. TA1 TaxID=2234087 RepID=UPI0012323739|nr:AsmA-like C-terminal domain-containing protein [Thermodesulfobacterium sp. TA1]QER42343.1 hypothetical protein F1847_06140 [Thermodesulfobacterium sp. TA1]
MIKKLRFGILLLFLVLSLFGFFLVNIDFLLNQPWFKERLFKFLKASQQIDLQYEKIKVDLFEGKVKVKELSFKNKSYEIEVPEGTAVFSLSKIFRLNFFPETLQLKKLRLKAYFSPKPFNLYRLRDQLKGMGPFVLQAKEARIDYETQIGWLTFEKTDLFFKIDKNQALWELISLSSPLFKEAEIKGRLNLSTLFLENSVNLKAFDFNGLSKFKDLPINHLSSDLMAELSLEKETLNLSFQLLNPQLVLKEAPKERLLGGLITGVLIYQPDILKLDLKKIVFRNPYIEAQGEFLKKKDSISTRFKVKRLDLEEVKRIGLLYFEKQKEVKEVFDLVGGGILEEIEVDLSGKDFKDLIDYKKIKAKGRLKEGKIILGFLPLNLEKVTGEIGFVEGRLNFNGTLAIEEQILGTVKNFGLVLSKKQPEVWLEGTITGKAEKIKNLVLNFEMFKSYQQKIKDFKTEGNLVSNIELKGPLTDLNLKVGLVSEDMILTLPDYRASLQLKTADLAYYRNRLFLSNLHLLTEGLNLKNGMVDLNFNSMDVWVKVLGLTIKPAFIEVLEEKQEEIGAFLKERKLQFEALEIEEGWFKGNLNQLTQEQTNLKQTILNNLYLKGKASKVSLVQEEKGERFEGYTEYIPLVWQQGVFEFGEAPLEVEGSAFMVKGKVFGEEVYLEVKGELKEGLKTKIEKLLGLDKGSFQLKAPIKIESLALGYKKEEVKTKGNYQILDKEISLNLEQTKDQTFLSGSFIGKESQQHFSAKLSKTQVDLNLQGKLRLEELVSIFAEIPYQAEGWVESHLSLNFKKDKDFLDSLIDRYLNKELLVKEGLVRFQGVKVKDSLGIDGEIKINQDLLVYGNFKVEWDNSTVLADLKLDKNPKSLLLTGGFKAEKIDLKKLVGVGNEQKTSNKESKKDFWEYFKGVPLIADIKIGADKLIFPTSHEMEHLSLEVNLNTKAKLLWVNLSNAKFCGIGVDFIYSLSEGVHQAFVDLLPSEGDFLDLFSCLYPEEMPKVILEGPYKMKGYAYLEGDNEELLKNTQGELTIKSKKGYVYRAPLVAHLLGFLSPIDLFSGKVPNLENQLLPYEELNFRSKLEDKTLIIDEAFLSASGFRLFGEGPINLTNKQLNLTFYASPFKTVDVIIEKIPKLGPWVLGKPRMLVYIPLQVIGTYDNYTIVPLHPSSIGKGVFNFIFRLFGISEDFYQKNPKVNLNIKSKKEELLKGKEEMTR